ncbi:MAG: NADH:flavin oxidoreductase/NADH oxidase [Chloroflexota bacterium]
MVVTVSPSATARQRVSLPPSASLFEPYKTRGITLRNRIAVAPMCQYSAEDGVPTDWHLVHLGTRAVGGAAVVMAEATAIEPRGRISAHDCGIWADTHIQPWSRIARFILEQGAVPAIQLAHAGRKASVKRTWEGGGPLAPEDGGWQPLAPSAIPFDAGWHVPEALSLDGIERVVQGFRQATTRAVEAGFQIIEIHAAHGYLLHEFLSPLSNRRVDDYGGSLENRVRLLLRVTEVVRDALPDDLPLWVRISATDWVGGGWTVDESVALSAELARRGVDLVDVSSGGSAASAKIPLASGYQVPFAERVRQEAGVPTGAVGLITKAELADEILRNGRADVVLLARELLRNPYWPLYAAHELKVDVDYWPLQYQRARP